MDLIMRVLSKGGGMWTPKSPTHYRRVEVNEKSDEAEGLVTITGIRRELTRS